MDLTELMHGGPGRLLSCATCGLAVRDELSAARYEEDVYDSDLLRHLYPRYQAAFQSKEAHYRDLVPPGAEIIELGSHLGAFLEVAESWSWRPIGLDIGRITSAFARDRGLTVRRASLDEAKLSRHHADALFIWNCFEQLEEPSACLRSAHSVLKPYGLVIVRTPNVTFYEQRREALGKAFRRRALQAPILVVLGIGPSALGKAFRRRALQELGYNNLLGFPYLAGYSPSALASLLRRNGFAPVMAFDSTPITVPFADPLPQVERDSERLRRRDEQSAAIPPENLSGPWIEIVARRETN